MPRHPQDADAQDPLRRQWGRVEEMREWLVERKRIFLSEPQRLGLGLLGIASGYEEPAQRIDSLTQAQKLLLKGLPTPETEERLALLDRHIERLKEMESHLQASSLPLPG